jgi:hypothetical protein
VHKALKKQGGSSGSAGRGEEETRSRMESRDEKIAMITV